MIKCGGMTLDHCDGREGKSVHHHPPSSIREEIVMKVGDSGQDMQRGRDGSYVTIRGNGRTKSGEEKCVCVCGGGGTRS